MYLLDFHTSIPPLRPMIDAWRELATTDAVRYGLALAAASLLPFKSKWAYRGVCVALFLLWIGAAVELNPASAASCEASWWWSGIAAVEALLLLVLGLSARLRLGGRALPSLDFPARNGGWAVAGTVAILYCLIAFPLLARFYWSPLFAHSTLDFPFPLVLFTAAVLFFCVGRAADIALAPLFVWAFLGGPGFPHAGHSERLVLTLVLLASALFFLHPAILRGGSERRAAPGDEYRLVTRQRAPFAGTLWSLVLLTLLLSFLLVLAEYDLPPLGGRILFDLALLSALGIALWLAFAAWHSPWFRYAAWHAARAAGRAGSGVRRSWKWVLLPLLVVLLVASQIQKIQTSGSGAAPPQGKGGEKQGAPAAAGGSGETADSSRDPAPEGFWGRLAAFFTEPFADLRTFLAGNSWFWIVLGAVLLWLLYQAYRGSRLLVIGEFENHAGGTAPAELVKGLGARLQAELARISELYKIIDEARPVPKGGGTIEVTAGVQDVGDILQEASEISVGSVKISGKLLSGLAAALIRGPQLKGALHKVPGGYALTAHLTRGSRSVSWRVDLELPPTAAPVPAAPAGAAAAPVPAASAAPAAAAAGASAPPAAPAVEAALEELVHQLAFRVATELVDIGSPRWKAVRCFTDGLRYYRDTQRRVRDRESDLRQAERCLIRALNDDRRFTQCHHNLGVVYRELRELGSAQAAFRRALEEDPSRFETFYALAEAYVQDEKHLEAAWFCKAAIGIDAADARPWDLWAFARRRQGRQSQSAAAAAATPLDLDDSEGKEVLEMRRIAVALAWRALCREALRGGSPAVDKLRDTARLATFNLAVLLARSTRAGRVQADRDESVRLLRQAAWISPHDTDLRLHQGRALLWSERPDDAAAALDGVFADGLSTAGRGLLWSSLTMTRARSGAAAARLVHRRFLDLAAATSPRDLGQLIENSLETPPPEKTP